MFRFNTRIAIFPLVAMILSALIVIGYSFTPAYSSEAKKTKLYGLPIALNFTDLPAVPEKIEAAKPSPQAAAVLKKIKAAGSNTEVAQAAEAKKPYLYGLPIIINFPNLPAVPEKIKAAKPSPQAGAALKNIPSYSRPSTSDGPDAAKSR